MVMVQTRVAASDSSVSTPTQIEKYGSELVVGDVMILNGNNETITSITINTETLSSPLLVLGFSDGSYIALPSQIYTVVGPPQITGTTTGLLELGLSIDPIVIAPKFTHRDLKTDDFGPDTPADVIWYLGTALVSMNLIHYDYSVLDFCIAESMGGLQSPNSGPRSGNWAGGLGGMAPAGTPLGGGSPLYSEKCHYIGLILKSPRANIQWNFPATYLAEQPFELPLGTERSVVRCRWRAIPYTFVKGRVEQPLSRDAVLWTHPDDASGKTTDEERGPDKD